MKKQKDKKNKKDKKDKKDKKKQQHARLSTGGTLHFINSPNHDDIIDPNDEDGPIKIAIAGFDALPEGFGMPTITITEDDGTEIPPTAAIAPTKDPNFPGAWFASVTIDNPNDPDDPGIPEEVFVFCAVKIEFEKNDGNIPSPSRRHLIRIKVKKAPSA